MFNAVITHALARAHGVVGGAILVEHMGFVSDDDDDDDDDDGSVCVGIVKCHRDDADKLRTAVALLTETHDGTARCGAAVMASSSSLVSLANKSRRIAAGVVRGARRQVAPR